MYRMQSLRRPGLTALAAAAALAVVGTAGAVLTAGQDIIAAPASVVNSSVAGGASNTHQQAFNERQVVLLTAALDVDAVADIPAGTMVSSHMIFLNQPDTAAGGLSDLNVTWTFSGPILGVMSDANGTLEAASNALLGAPGTAYPGAFGARGMEGADSYAVAGNAIVVNMNVFQPGDWIRVVTRATADDCKKGGWMTNPAFKNQGDCVSFIKTNGGNEPGQNIPTAKE